MICVTQPERHSYWSRCIEDAKPGPQARFKENLELFFEAVQLQTRDRDSGVIPDLESYINVRLSSSLPSGGGTEARCIDPPRH